VKHWAGGVALGALTACAPFGPNATGRWAGACDGPDGFDVLLEVAEEVGGGGDLEGEVLVADRDQDADAVEEHAWVHGYREGRVVHLNWEQYSKRSFEAELELRGDELTGKVMLSGWQPRGSCELELDR